MESLERRYQNIDTPEELFEFMNRYFSYGYLSHSGKILVSSDIDFDDGWYLNYKLQGVSDILKTRIGNCFDMVEFEREWFSRHGYLNKTFFEMVKVNYLNPYPMHAFLVYKKDNSWFLFEFSDVKNRGIFQFFSLCDLLEYQKHTYINVLKEHNILEEELRNIVIKEFSRPKIGISAEMYLEHIFKG